MRKQVVAGRQLLLRVVVGSCLIAAALVATAPGADAAPGDIGFEGPSYAGMTPPATNEKPQSKLWRNDGIWWADLFDSADGRHEIWRLNTGTQTWTSTNVALDSRPGSHTDILWDGSKLYVASTIFRTVPLSGTPSYLYRYSYNAATDQYSLDAGFPSQINNFKTETLVIDKDSTGELWATWTQGSTRQVYVATSDNGGGSWNTPFLLPVGNAATTDSDDISSLIAFQGNKIGLMWSNQRLDTMYFAIHNDSAADNSWGTPELAYSGTNRADDHINLKTDGTRIFAATKTSTNPLNMLLRRNTDGSWTAGTFGTSGDSHTRPIVVLNTSAQVAHVFATCGQPPSGGGQSGGDICTKTTSMNGSLSFPSGVGTPVIRWLANGDNNKKNMNNATSTKQNVDNSSGLVVLASIGYTTHYWHHFDALGGGGPTQPVANFTANPTSGTGSLNVSFTDTSTNGPTQWAWDFQNNGSVDSNAQNPSFNYTTPGTYTVKLTASNGAGSDDEIKTNFITVNAGGSAPVANFTANPTSGTGSLNVSFTDTSTNGPTQWAWDFQNNGSVDSNAENPSFNYTTPGTYTVKLTASNGAGSDDEIKTNFITVNPTGGGGTLTFIPVADAWVSNSEPTTNFGLDTALRVRGSSNPRFGYLRFNVAGLSGTATAKLRVFVTDPSPVGGTAYTLTDNGWVETEITFSTAPPVGSPLSTLGAVTTGTWVEFNLGTISANGLVSFALKQSGTNDAVYYSSREGANPPQLVLTTQ